MFLLVTDSRILAITSESSDLTKIKIIIFLELLSFFNLVKEKSTEIMLSCQQSIENKTLAD